MPTLQEMLNRSKAQPQPKPQNPEGNSQNGEESPTQQFVAESPNPNRSLGAALGRLAESNDSTAANEPEQLPSGEGAASDAPKKPGFKLGGFKLAGPKPAESNAGPKPDQLGERGPVVAEGFSEDNPRPSEGGSDASDSLPRPAATGLAAIAGLGANLDSISGTLASIADFDSHGYPDMVTPTAPERVIDGMEEDAKAFVKVLDSMYMVFDDRDLFVSSVQRIMIELGNNPHLHEMILPEDDNTIIRGMRATAGMARIQKKEAKAKRAGTGRAKKELSDKEKAVMQSIQGLASFGGFDDD